MIFPTEREIPDRVRVDAGRWQRQWLAGGEVRRWEGAVAPVVSPVCTREGDTLTPVTLGEIAMLDAAAATDALAAASAAWDDGRGAWPTMRVGERIERLESFLAGMKLVRDDVVKLLMWEIGKTEPDSAAEFDRTVAYCKDTIDALKEQDRGAGRFVLSGGFAGMIRRTPLGVVLCMGPFNYPLNETYTTLIPALVMGNPVVSKLPKLGCLLHLPILSAMRDAFPPGVVNVIQGDGATVVGPIMESGLVDCLAFIGSSRVANILERQHPRLNRLRTVFGLEAKNPGVVMPSADLDLAVKECVAGALTFNGQRCTGLKLLFVHESIADAFVAKLCTAVDALKAGMPWEPGVTLTPLPEPGKPAWMADLVEDAVLHGAHVVNQGGHIEGTFFRPAVVYPVTPAMKLYHEEQFGPVLPVATYRDLSEIDEFMRRSPYGQQVALFGQDPKEMATMVDALVNQVSRINLNSQCRRGPDSYPFTGRKDSAEGTLSVTDALRAFSIRAVVATAQTPANQELVGEIVNRRLSSFLSTDFLF